jgi:AraC-like DNA-binding protein/quercetin dioxygenase-like cupin family protein
MSRNGQQSMFVCTFPMPPGTVYDWHTHDDHQLAWAASGVLTVHTEQATWVLPPTRALWIPAGLRHETGAAGRATMQSAYVRPGLLGRPDAWTEPVPVAASPLFGGLLGYLSGSAPGREHAEALLEELLTPVPATDLNVRWPADEPALTVAERLRADPADDRTLAQWGRETNTSERTLARAFTAGTGMAFGQWRTMFRLQAALPMLAAGDAVGRVAGRVGYQTPSAFVAAFRRATGVTPAAYFGSFLRAD